ncbi:MAG TPA: hypothetical protein VH333_17600 [Pseudonocardiaceae bacterium]|jgi:hypothetical protein|nr:hypothetical protein [Pseudonocardiaceae bacterium]
MRWSVLVTLLTCCLVAAGCTTTINGSAVAAGAPSCVGGTVVQPKGAPYCYLLPAGFVDVTDHVTLQYRSANPGRYITSVEVAQLDVITVSDYPLRTDSDSVSMSSLTNQIVAALPDPAAGGLTPGQPTTTTLDGARTVELTFDQTGEYSSVLYFAFRGYDEIEVDCQWAADKAEIDRGCASVRDTIRF